MKITIMQPYFLPYIGYWQLLSSVDTFILYDNIKYTKKGWINRNRFLLNGKDSTFTLPLKSASDNLDICERFLSEDYQRIKLIRQFENAYRKSPQFSEFETIKKCIESEDGNLFKYIFESIKIISQKLDIKCNIILSSSLPFDHKTLKSQDKVLAICKHFNASQYINPIGGIELYDKKSFQEQNIELRFLKTDEIIYKQFENQFIPYLSIVDVMMFNSNDNIKAMLCQHQLIEGK